MWAGAYRAHKVRRYEKSNRISSRYFRIAMKSISLQQNVLLICNRGKQWE